MTATDLIQPNDPRYDTARAAWNLTVDQRPAAVARPRDAGEVAEVVRAATAAGLRVAPQGTGHNAGPLAAQNLQDVVLLRTSALDEVTVDPQRQTVRVGAGALWQPVVESAAHHGLAALHGSSPDVGVAGYTLGGGVSWYARRYGLAASGLRAAEVVLADGNLVRADAAHESDLFWALRGAGGAGFGVVTALELDLHPIRQVLAGMMVWDIVAAERVLRGWADWALNAPDQVTTSLRLLRLPPAPELPEILRGRSVVIIDGAVLGSEPGGVLAELRDLRPELDTFADVPAASLIRLHMDPEGAAPVVSDTRLLDALPDTAVASILEAAGPDARTELGLVELRQLGGALAQPLEDGGALTHLDGRFLAFAGTVAPTTEVAEAGRRQATTLVDQLAPYGSGSTYLNVAENSVDVARGFPDDVWRRLRQLRTAVDPKGVFVGNHPV